MRLVATILNRIDLDHFHHHPKLYWIALRQECSSLSLGMQFRFLNTSYKMQTWPLLTSVFIFISAASPQTLFAGHAELLLVPWVFYILLTRFPRHCSFSLEHLFLPCHLSPICCLNFTSLGSPPWLGGSAMCTLSLPSTESNALKTTACLITPNFLLECRLHEARDVWLWMCCLTSVAGTW